jgi:hypothetical protein
MDDAERVRRVHGVRRLSQPPKRLCARDPPGPEPLVDAAAALVLHDDVRTPPPLPDVVDGDDVRVAAQTCSQDRFAREAFWNRRIGTELGRQQLDGDVSFELDVVGEDNLGR